MGFQKKEYFWGYEDFVNIFLGHHKIGLYLGVVSIILGYFLKVKVQNVGYFFGLLKFQIFWGAWNSWYFWDWTLDAGSEPTYEEKKDSDWCPAKCTSWYVRQSMTLIRMRTRAVWSESSMDALYVAKGQTFLQA